MKTATVALLAVALAPTFARAEDAPAIPLAPVRIDSPADATPDATAAPTRSPVVAIGSVSERYAAGVASYEAGRFEDAESIFRALVADGHAEPTILLGLGNAAYRLGRFVEAVYAYEWARSLSPGDKDVAANLEMARAHLIADQLPTQGSAAGVKLREILTRIPTEWTALGFVVLWTLGWIVIALRQRGRLVGHAWIGVAALLAALGLAAHVGFRLNDAHGAPRGVLQAGQIEVRSGPGDSYATLFTLHAGTIVEQREDRADWRRVAIPNGPEGWVPAKALVLFGRPEMLAAGS